MVEGNPNVPSTGWKFIAGDPLRGVAGIAVLVTHAAIISLLATSGLPNAGGQRGVYEAYGDYAGTLLLFGSCALWLFFVLSGYLIGRPFVRALVKDRPFPSLLSYARSRVLRVYPAYLTMLAIVLVVYVWLQGRARISDEQLLDLLVFHFTWDNHAGKPIGQAWTLGVEMKFYIALPLVALAVARLARRLPGERQRALAIAVPCLVWVAVAPFVVPGEPGVRSFAYIARLFAAGVAIAALEPLIQPLVAGSRRWARVALALTLLAFLYVAISPVLLYGIGFPYDVGLGDLALDVAVAMLIAAPLLRQWADGRCWRALDNRLTTWLGERSYSIYLVHMLVMYEVARAFVDVGDGYKVTLLWLLPVTLAVSLAAAELLYRAVERPYLVRKQQQAGRARARPAVAVRS